MRETCAPYACTGLDNDLAAALQNSLGKYYELIRWVSLCRSASLRRNQPLG
jgi:hypothetical protein